MKIQALFLTQVQKQQLPNGEPNNLREYDKEVQQGLVCNSKLTLALNLEKKKDKIINSRSFVQNVFGVRPYKKLKNGQRQ